MTDEELNARMRTIIKQYYPYLLDKRVTKFIEFLQNNYELKDAPNQPTKANKENDK